MGSCSGCKGTGNMILRATDSQGNVSYAVWKASVPISSSRLNTPKQEVLVPVSPRGCSALHDMRGGIREPKCTGNADSIPISPSSDPVYLVFNTPEPSTSGLLNNSVFITVV